MTMAPRDILCNGCGGNMEAAHHLTDDEGKRYLVADLIEKGGPNIPLVCDACLARYELSGIRGDLGAPPQMTEREQIQKLIAACRAYHDALDIACAMLVQASFGKPAGELFFPTKSPMWPAIVNGKAIVDEIEAALAEKTAAISKA